MNNRLTDRERKHIGRVKELPCSLCDTSGPSEAHHLDQSCQYLCAALCPDCHRGASGWHGTKVLWNIKKMTELDALNVTLRRLIG